MSYPLVRELAAEGIPVRLTCGVLGFSPQAFYKWRANPVSDRDWVDAHLTHALIDAHGDAPEFGYRFLTDELERDGHQVGERRVWRLCRQQRLWSTIVRKGRHGSRLVHHHVLRRVGGELRLRLQDGVADGSLTAGRRAHRGAALPLPPGAVLHRTRVSTFVSVRSSRLRSGVSLRAVARMTNDPLAPRDLIRSAVLARRPVDSRERWSIDEFVRHFDPLTAPFDEVVYSCDASGCASRTRRSTTTP